MADRLLGRERELTQICGVLETLGDRAQGEVVLIEGPPGSGKTRLLEDTLAEAQRRGFTVMDRPAGRAGAVIDVHEMGALLGARSCRAADATAGPWIAAVDDLHLAMSGAGPAPFRLREQIAAEPLVWVLTAPSGEPGPEVRRLLARSTVLSRIELGPLPCDAVVALVAGRAGAVPADDLRAVVATAAGNPLLIVELVEGLREEGGIEVRDGRAHLLADRVPRRVHEVVRYWFSALSPPAQQFLQIAATLGQTFCFETVAGIQGGTAAGLLPVLNEAIAAGLLRSVDEQTTFVHGLVWRAIAENVPPSVRHALHRQFRGTPRDGAAVGASADALVPAVLLARATLTEPLAADVVDDLRRLLAGTPATCRLPGTADPVGAAADRIVGLFGTDTAAVTAEARTIVAAHADRPADADLLAATTVLSNLSWAAGQLDDGLHWGRTAALSADDSAPPAWRPYPRLTLAAKLAEIGRRSEAERLIQEARDTIARLGLSAHQAPPLVIHARILLQAGRTSDAYERAQAGLALAAEAPSRWVTPYAQAVLALVTLRLGDITTAADHVWRCRAAARAYGTVFPSVRIGWCEFLIAVAQLGEQRALDLLTTRHADLLSQRSLYLEEPGAAAWLIRIALAADQVALAASVAATAEELAAANRGFPTVRLSARHARGVLDQDPDALREAAAGHGDPWAAALAEEDLGRLGRSGHPVGCAETAERLGRALAGFQRIGARNDAARVSTLLNSGTPAPVPAAPNGTEVTWARLSDTEQAIIRYVGEGLTNRQVARRVSLSPHTVNYHLRVLFRKFGVGSRVELARHLPHAD
ncbi:LuxR C-terminal-related transcriptional regulator [Jidongwangia harbinensis]|uniref:LuxR C-terminal-related transcriptional regulator n=1 Tax=Jidongwangia harbinensis TaxID=2878561 RepID=UPI001CD98EDC|nr:LuxR family transcriptional regulator [Jidongwangia harbinensis]MCA2218268.1 LuxR C-terminal-related transcriptional regulator [Jidongwangia harbinensis]